MCLIVSEKKKARSEGKKSQNMLIFNEQCEEESGDVEYAWDSSDEQEEGHEKNSIYMGLNGRRRQGRRNRHPQAIGRMGHMEI